MIIGLFLKHVKAYKGINFVPVGVKYRFVTYVGENGAGKSSILEALDAFFNCKAYPINKGAISDSIRTQGNEPFITPIFLIDKSRVPRQKKEFEKISHFFWAVKKTDLHSGVRNSMAEFFSLREQLQKENSNYNETHYLIVAGETNLTSNAPIPYFASFQGEDCFATHILDEQSKIKSDNESVGITEKVEKKGKSDRAERLAKLLITTDWKKFLNELKHVYSFVYFPVELEVESFTKIETSEMQKIFDKHLKSEIEKSLSKVNLNKVGGINKTLNGFVTEIEEILNNEYCYHTGQDRYNTVTKSDLVNKILEVYFQKRVLNKKSAEGLTKVSELSAGEKRQALIHLVYAFLKRNKERDQLVIIGIDEPENSLHTTLCYDQFEKLKEISENNQILITTHWYGFLPIISNGYAHFLSTKDTKDKKISFESYDLYDYRARVKKQVEESRNRMPANFVLKSTYDLVQSIFYSLKKDSPYNWIICEGVSEKIYFEYFFKAEIEQHNLRILPMGGQSNVIRLYTYLVTPMAEEDTAGKVYCLVDTDQTRCREIGNGRKNIQIRRLCNRGANDKTSLLTLDHSDTSPTDIEQALYPTVFIEAMNRLTDSEKDLSQKFVSLVGNTDFIKNFRDLELEAFFKENKGENKVLFAKRYVDVAAETDEGSNDIITIPPWVGEIKKFFNS
ncbi:MAG: AAA family ATPase [Algicola sp.]|nr:AAA family ATPase [Algicola sp.]